MAAIFLLQSVKQGLMLFFRQCDRCRKLFPNQTFIPAETAPLSVHSDIVKKSGNKKDSGDAKAQSAGIKKCLFLQVIQEKYDPKHQKKESKGSSFASLFFDVPA
jgi:hypothetical protein